MNQILHHKLLITSGNSLYKPALFLDRDGVVIHDRHYISNPCDVTLIHGISDLILAANKAGFRVVIVTNQSGISRGFFSWNDYERVTERMLELLGSAAQPSAIYANGYGPDSLKSSWRKPNDGMLISAAQDLSLDLRKSLLIGDRLSDMQAGFSARIKAIIHVLTGHGFTERDSVSSWWSSLTDLYSTKLYLVDSPNNLADMLFTSHSIPNDISSI